VIGLSPDLCNSRPRGNEFVIAGNQNPRVGSADCASREFQPLETWSKQMKSFFRRFLKNESGATAIEYGLIAALISIVIIVGVGSIGTKLSKTFDMIQNNLPN
jgi:pilus assembly protein Flp/PilA